MGIMLKNIFLEHENIELKNKQDNLIEQSESYKNKEKDEYTTLCEQLYELVMAKEVKK